MAVFEVISSYLKHTKISDDLKNEAQSISYALQLLTEKGEKTEIMGILNTVSVFDQVTPEDMSEEQQKDSILEIVYQYVQLEKNLKHQPSQKLSQRMCGNIFCSLTD